MTNETLSMERKRVAIIGAGTSGLAACKYALAKGFLPVVFEANTTLGGIWNHTSALTRLQTPKSHYQFSDFPWPTEVETEFPHQQQVMDYLETYAFRFDLLRHVQFGTRVVGIEYEGVSEEKMAVWDYWAGNGDAFGGMGKWTLRVQIAAEGTTENHHMDFVILCIGRFSDLPTIPTFPTNRGPNIFEGKVIHSMDFSNMEPTRATKLVRGKQVVVVGYKKSALDIASECANVNGVEYPCTMIYRTMRWTMPNLKPWGIPLSYFYFTRFAELLFHKPGEGILLSLLATILSPLKWLFSTFIESYFRWKLPMKKYGMVPEQSFFQAMSACSISKLPTDFYDRVEERSIILKNSAAFCFYKNGVLLNSESIPIKADLVILATGYESEQKLKDIFISPSFKNIVAGSPTSIVPLYRQCIHPRIPQLAIIGYPQNTSNLFTSEILSRWLMHFLDGGFKLPSIRCMEQNILEWDKFMKKYSRDSYRRLCISIVLIWHSDQLCRDMGCNPRRKKGFLADWFLPYGPMDYVELHAKKKTSD